MTMLPTIWMITMPLPIQSDIKNPFHREFAKS